MNDEASTSGRASAALDTAERIAKAICDKITSHKPYVRHIESANSSYIELAFRPKNGSRNTEVATGYSESWFNDSKMSVKEKAKFIYTDVRKLLNLA